MTTAQIETVETSLIKFIVRVSNEENATPAELGALPEVAMSLVQISKL